MSKTEGKKGCPASLLLEAYALESLNETMTRTVQRHLQECTPCTAEIVRINREREAHLLLNPASKILATITAQQRQPVFRFAWAKAIPVCLVLLIGFVFFFPTDSSKLYHGLKGDLSFNFYVTRDNTSFIGKNGIYFPGDQLQFSFYAPEPVFLYILNIDETGRIAFYYPESEANQQPVLFSQKGFLPISITLDDYVGLERIFVIASEDPCPFSYLEGKVIENMSDRSLREVSYLGGLNTYQKSILIEKRG